MKRYFIDDQGRRSTSDVGGSKTAKGLENKSLYDIQVQGELGEFVKVLKVLENYSEVQSINVIQGTRKEFSDTKRFVFLNDGVTGRKYVIGEIMMFSGRGINLIKVEREDKAISTLIYFLDNHHNKTYAYQRVLIGLINGGGAWDKEQLQFSNIDFLTLRHGKKEVNHRASNLFQKMC